MRHRGNEGGKTQPDFQHGSRWAVLVGSAVCVLYFCFEDLVRCQSAVASCEELSD